MPWMSGNALINKVIGVAELIYAGSSEQLQQQA